MELNREQIVKACRACASAMCFDCPLWGDENCVRVLTEHGGTLIRELTEENKRLTERLNREAKCQYALATEIVDLKDEVAQIKADTARKMQERLKESLVGFSDEFRYWAEGYIAKIAKSV